MGRKRHSVEQIIGRLRQAEIEQGRGATVAESCKKIEVTEQTYYRWRKEYGGLQINQARRLRELEKENQRLKKLVAEQALDKAILEEALKGKY